MKYRIRKLTNIYKNGRESVFYIPEYCEKFLWWETWHMLPPCYTPTLPRVGTTLEWGPPFVFLENAKTAIEEHQKLQGNRIVEQKYEDISIEQYSLK